MARCNQQLCALFAAAVLVLLAVATPAAAGPSKLPPEFKLCKKGTPNFVTCVENSIMGALKTMAPGLPDFGIPSLDPMFLPALEIGDPNSDAPVNLHMKLTNIIIHNLKEARTKKSEFDVDKFNLKSRGAIDVINAESDYEMDGRILLIPAKGKGRCVFNLTNLEADLEVKGEKLVKKDKMYMKVNDLIFNVVSIEKMTMHFENLFNGDKTLGTTVNNLVNDNWQEIWSQLKPALEVILRHQFKEFSRRIFEKVPYEEIFLPK